MNEILKNYNIIYMPPPNIWGPIYWKLFHNITTIFPDNSTQLDKDNFINFVNAFKNLLPCKECREHFVYNLNILPLTNDILSSKYNLILWGINIHNIVREMLKKNIYYKNSIETIESEIKKNKLINTQKLLGNVMYISITEITLNFKVVYNDFYIIFYSINNLLIQKNINLETILKNKKMNISFNSKSDILKIANILC